MKAKAILIAVKALLNFHDHTLMECQERIDLAKQLLDLCEDA